MVTRVTAGVTIKAMPYDVMVILDDSPGELARLGEVSGAAGVNIDLAYTTFGGVRLVFGTDDIRVARTVLEA